MEETRRKTVESRCERLLSESSLSKTNEQSVRAELAIKNDALEIMERKLLDEVSLNTDLRTKERMSLEDILDKEALIEVCHNNFVSAAILFADRLYLQNKLLWKSDSRKRLLKNRLHTQNSKRL